MPTCCFTSSRPSRVRRVWPVTYCWFTRPLTRLQSLVVRGYTTQVSVVFAVHLRLPTTDRVLHPTVCVRRITSICSTAHQTATTGNWWARRKCTFRTTPTSWLTGV